DTDNPAWGGKGVDGAIEHVIETIQPSITGLPVTDQTLVDEMMLEIDGTPNKSELGANAILGVSLAVLRAAADYMGQPLWRYVGGLAHPSLPVPQMNILNGGAHASNGLDVQEFMVVPHGFDIFPEALRAGVETYHALKGILKESSLSTSLGDEGGFAPTLASNKDALRLLIQAIEAAGYRPGTDLSIALDVAASEFFEDGNYRFEGKTIDGDGLMEVYRSWLDEFPIVSIEDGFAEDDWESWAAFTRTDGDRVQLVGDDLFVTNIERFAQGLETDAANAILIKPNQIGTISETLEVIRLAVESGWGTVMSHRSGETEDTTIADLAVGCGCGQIKTGAPARSDRTAKYNRLLRISEELEGFDPTF
ncbi:MAG TPA: phosphopyruvate hydratase, partial [Candidatus Poseidoniales archaeon]|nr:phosphopyruvate hydratase [Candidatus Poseidoniales archaeon]